MQNKNYKELKNFCLKQGVDIFGVADISQIKDEFNLSKKLIDNLHRAICVGVRLSEQIFKDIQDAPTKLYFHHYRTANQFLDQVAFKLTNWLQYRGAEALPIAASQIVDWQRQTAHVSHKKLGYLAGLGWIGRNNLLVNSRYGSGFRLTNILTNFNIKADKPVNEDCGDCYECLKVCPVKAIKDRRQDFDHQQCFEKLKEFQRANIVGQYICGICVRACIQSRKR